MDGRTREPATVEFRRADYDARALAAIVPALLDGTGMRPIAHGMRVLIKPNFLAPAAPERAMTTHPLVLRAVVEHVLDQGGRPTRRRQPGPRQLRAPPARGRLRAGAGRSGRRRAALPRNREGGHRRALRPHRYRARGRRGGPGGQPPQAEDAHHDAADARGEEPLRLRRGPGQARVAHAQRDRPHALRAPARPDPPRREPGGHPDRRHPRDGGRGPGPQRHPAPPGPARGRGHPRRPWTRPSAGCSASAPRICPPTRQRSRPV